MFRAAHYRTRRSPRVEPRILVLAILPVVVAGGVLPAAQADAATSPAVVPSRSFASTAWFHDPLTAPQRAALPPVPSHPRSVHGRLQRTQAVWRSHGGMLAVPAVTAQGHQLQRGQAVTLSRRNLFAAGSAQPSMATRARVAALAVSMGQVTAVTCEGYADFTGNVAREGRLAAKRAAKICSLLAAARPGLATSSRSFGWRTPVLVGGRPSQRAANRRIVVLATAVRPAKTPPASTTPPLRATAPGAPTLSSVTGGVNTATLTFAAPASNGGSPITGYEWSTDQTTWHPATTTGSSPYTVTLSSLLAGTSTYWVRAVNAVGNGPASTGVPATVSDPATVPGAPTLSSVVGGVNLATLTFSAPSSNGGSPITGYEWSTDQTTWHSLTTTGSSPYTVQLSSLLAGTATYYVRAVNAVGNGPASTGSAAIVTDPVLPNAPSVVGNEVFCTEIVVWFYPGAPNAATVTGYEFSTDSGATWTTAANVVNPSSDPNETQRRFVNIMPGGCVTGTQLIMRATSADGPGASSSPVALISGP